MKAKRSEAATEIAKGTQVKGALRGSEDLVVRGRIEGTIDLEASVFVENSGIVKADVRANRVTIAGVVVGDVTATSAVEITPEGRVLGDLAAPTVRVAEGAKIRGGLAIGRADGERPAATRPSPAPVKVATPAPAPAPIVRRAEPTPVAADDRRRTTVTNFSASKPSTEDKKRKRVVLKKRR